jgi:ABC-type dipeptide/oligopeptide/nickel transport system permease component
MGIAILVGGSLGIEAAVSPNSVVRRVALAFALVSQAIPAFWLGTILIYFFAVRLNWLPSSGLEGAASVILPAVTLAAYPAAMITRLIRAAMGEALSGDYIRTARAKGLSHWRIVFDHALRNALLPTISFIGLQAGFFFGGAVVVEGVFAYPGIGMLALDAAFSRDIPIVGAFVWTVAILILMVNLALDVVAAQLDPRLRADASPGMAAT